MLLGGAGVLLYAVLSGVSYLALRRWHESAVRRRGRGLIQGAVAELVRLSMVAGRDDDPGSLPLGERRERWEHLLAGLGSSRLKIPVQIEARAGMLLREGRDLGVASLPLAALP